MNVEPYNNLGGHSAKHWAELRRKPSGRSLIILVALALIALALMTLPRPSIYYPNVIIEASGGVQLDLLLKGRQDKAACETAIASTTSAITSSCRECRTRSQNCIRNLSPELRQRFEETPLPVPSARMANGIVIYNASQGNIALLTCMESERQAARNADRFKIACYQPGVKRSRTAFEKSEAQDLYTTFTLVLTLAGVVLVSLVAVIGLTYVRQRRHIAYLSLSGIRIPTPHPWLEKFTLAAIDALILLGTFIALSWPDNDDINRWSWLDRATVLSHGLVMILTLGWFLLVLEHYSRRRPFWDELREIFRVLIVMFMVSGAVAFVAGLESGRSSHIMVWALNFMLIPLGRAGAKQLLDDFGLWQRPAVIIGAGENARAAYLAIKSERGMGYRVLGFIAFGSCDASKNIAGRLKIGEDTLPVLVPSPSVQSLLNNLGDPRIILALDSLTDQESQNLIHHLLAIRKNIHIIPSIRGLPLFGTELSHFFSHEVLFLTVRNNLSRRGYQQIKRAFDIVGASALMLVLSPLMLYVAWRILREDGRPIIFRQSRVAKRSGKFGILKFRSMVKDADKILARWRESDSHEWKEYCASNFKLKNDPRMLKCGRWMRASSIDELPQLVNVLRGEMSLVGPRPLLPRELCEYGNSINYYRQIRPGITGLWQISGRSQTRFSDRAALDEWYVQNWSLWYDIAILMKTVDVVLHKRGAW